MDNTYEEIAKIVLDLQAGKEDSFEELYLKTQKIVFFELKASGVPDNDIEDLLQEVYIKIYKNIDKINDVKASYKWIKQTAYRTGINYTQSSVVKHEKLVTEDMDTIFESDDVLKSPIPMPEDILESKESQRLVRQIIESLPEFQYKIILAFYFNESTVKEIAEDMEVPEGTVKTNLFRARNELKRKIEELEKTQNTKLYSIGLLPVIMCLFHSEAQACMLPLSLQGVGAHSLINKSATAIAETGKEVAAKSAAAKSGIGVGVKVSIGIVTTGLIGALSLTGYKSWRSHSNTVFLDNKLGELVASFEIADMTGKEAMLFDEDAYTESYNLVADDSGNKISVDFGQLMQLSRNHFLMDAENDIFIVSCGLNHRLEEDGVVSQSVVTHIYDMGENACSADTEVCQDCIENLPPEYGEGFAYWMWENEIFSLSDLIDYLNLDKLCEKNIKQIVYGKEGEKSYKCGKYEISVYSSDEMCTIDLEFEDCRFSFREYIVGMDENGERVSHFSAGVWADNVETLPISSFEYDLEKEEFVNAMDSDFGSSDAKTDAAGNEFNETIDALVESFSFAGKKGEVAIKDISVESMIHFYDLKETYQPDGTLYYSNNVSRPLNTTEIVALADANSPFYALSYATHYVESINVDTGGASSIIAIDANGTILGYTKICQDGCFERIDASYCEGFMEWLKGNDCDSVSDALKALNLSTLVEDDVTQYLKPNGLNSFSLGNYLITIGADENGYGYLNIENNEFGLYFFEQRNDYIQADEMQVEIDYFN